MEPTVITSPTTLPAVPVAASRGPLPRKVVWGALIIAAALPVILLITAVLVMLQLNYNFLNWME